MNQSRLFGLFGAIWGTTGVLGLLVYAIVRLTQTTYDAFGYDLNWMHYLLLIANTLFMAHAEGYKGFQLSFSPRVVARAHYLIANPSLSRIVLAPVFCMGFFHATRKRMIATWMLFFAIVLMIILIRLLPQPWRGMLDAGVVVGLTWGAISISIFSARQILGHPFDCSPETPESIVV